MVSEGIFPLLFKWIALPSAEICCLKLMPCYAGARSQVSEVHCGMEKYYIPLTLGDVSPEKDVDAISLPQLRKKERLKILMTCTRKKKLHTCFVEMNVILWALLVCQQTTSTILCLLACNSLQWSWPSILEVSANSLQKIHSQGRRVNNNKLFPPVPGTEEK